MSQNKTNFRITAILLLINVGNSLANDGIIRLRTSYKYVVDNWILDFNFNYLAVQSQNPVPDNLDSVIIKLNKTHVTILNDLDTALATALRTLKTDVSGRKYVIFKDLQNEDKSWYLVYDLIHHTIHNEEMDDEYFMKRSTGTSMSLSCMGARLQV